MLSAAAASSSLLVRCSARPAAVAVMSLRSMSTGHSAAVAVAVPPAAASTFSGAFTTSSNPNVAPHPAPLSHAPVTFPKNRLHLQVLDPANQKSAQEYIDDVPVIEVDGPTAICDGGDPRLGHPIEFIQLNKVNPEQPATCKYCGLRFIQSHHH